MVLRTSRPGRIRLGPHTRSVYAGLCNHFVFLVCLQPLCAPVKRRHVQNIVILLIQKRYLTAQTANADSTSAWLHVQQDAYKMSQIQLNHIAYWVTALCSSNRQMKQGLMQIASTALLEAETQLAEAFMSQNHAVKVAQKLTGMLLPTKSQLPSLV